MKEEFLRLVANLEEADYVVSGGKEIGRAEKFKILDDLVQAIGMVAGSSIIALGGSRSAVVSGWISRQHQAGQTGETVTPRLCIACGISGNCSTSWAYETRR